MADIYFIEKVLDQIKDQKNLRSLIDKVVTIYEDDGFVIANVLGIDLIKHLDNEDNNEDDSADEGTGAADGSAGKEKAASFTRLWSITPEDFSPGNYAAADELFDVLKAYDKNMTFERFYLMLIAMAEIAHIFWIDAQEEALHGKVEHDLERFYEELAEKEKQRAEQFKSLLGFAELSKYLDMLETLTFGGKTEDEKREKIQ